MHNNLNTLWVSAEILVTPGNLKSNDATGNPASGIKHNKNPPRHASTCTGILYFNPNSDIASILSQVPYGKLGVDPTS